MLESRIQSKIITRLQKAGWYVIKLILTNKSGIPDIEALKNGRAVFIEVKRPGEKPRKLQEVRHEELRMQGFEVYVMDNAIFEFNINDSIEKIIEKKALEAYNDSIKPKYETEDCMCSDWYSKGYRQCMDDRNFFLRKQAEVVIALAKDRVNSGQNVEINQAIINTLNSLIHETLTTNF